MFEMAESYFLLVVNAKITIHKNIQFNCFWLFPFNSFPWLSSCFLLSIRTSACGQVCHIDCIFFNDCNVDMAIFIVHWPLVLSHGNSFVEPTGKLLKMSSMTCSMLLDLTAIKFSEVTSLKKLIKPREIKNSWNCWKTGDFHLNLWPLKYLI